MAAVCEPRGFRVQGSSQAVLGFRVKIKVSRLYWLLRESVFQGTPSKELDTEAEEPYVHGSP